MISGTEVITYRHIRPRRDEQTEVALLKVIDQPENRHGQSVFGPATRMTKQENNGVASATTSQPETVRSKDPGVEDPQTIL